MAAVMNPGTLNLTPLNPPRPSTSMSTGFPKMHLPVIQHPSARLDATENLSVRGQSGMGGARSPGAGYGGYGGVGMEGKDGSNLPPLSSQSLSAWPGPVGKLYLLLYCVCVVIEWHCTVSHCIGYCTEQRTVLYCSISQCYHVTLIVIIDHSIMYCVLSVM
jgi:hypothetical protein